MTLAEELGAFAARVGPEDPGPPVREALATHLLDALGCALASADGPGPVHLRAGAGGEGRATAIGAGPLPPDRAALANAAAIGWLDRHDALLAFDEVLHPAEAIGAVLAAAEEADADGGTLLAAIALAYALAERLPSAAPVREPAFDGASHLGIAAAAGAARALGLDATGCAHALAIAAARAPFLGVARDGASDLARLAGPLAVRDGLEAALLARRGLTGPLEAFEGRRGLFEALTGPFRAGAPALDAATRAAIRLHPGDVRAQAALEAARELAGPGLAVDGVTAVEVLVSPLVARRLSAPAAGSSRDLRGLVAAALAGPAAGPGERARWRERIAVRGDPALARGVPAEAPAVVRVRRGRAVAEVARRVALGAPGRPASFDRVAAKLAGLAVRVPPERRAAVIDGVRALPRTSARALGGLLAVRP